MWQNLLTSTNDRYVALRCALLLAILMIIGIGVTSHALEAIWTQPALKPLPSIPETLPWADVPNGGLIVRADELDFGMRGETNRLTWKLTIHNPTDEAVTIDNFEPLCSCFILWSPSTIGPGESEELRLRLNLTPRNPLINEIHHEHLFPLRPIIREHPGRHPGWELQGRSRRAFRLPSHVFSWPVLQKVPGKIETRRFQVQLFPGTTEFAASCENADVVVISADYEQAGLLEVHVAASGSQNAENEALIQLTAMAEETLLCSVSVRILEWDPAE